jgi:hypothetical protein
MIYFTIKNISFKTLFKHEFKDKFFIVCNKYFISQLKFDTGMRVHHFL